MAFTTTAAAARRGPTSSFQTPAAVVMVRPSAFGFDPDTAATNAFQHRVTGVSATELQDLARMEFDALVAQLEAAGVDVCVVADRPDAVTPDAVFPNNWISLHEDGSVVLYPMCAPRRRLERRPDLLALLAPRGFAKDRCLDLTHHERHGRFLEGTGSVVFDHAARLAYACLSPRTDARVLDELCEFLRYTPITFHAVDRRGAPLYHTNVVMSIGERTALICADAIPDAGERQRALDALGATGRTVMPLTFFQLESFAGNVLELQTRRGRNVVAMSTTAAAALTAVQKARLTAHADIVASPVSWIERVGGGSVRCMLLGVPRVASSDAG